MELQETFGGKIVENCTQSIARDLLAHAMQNLESAGYSIVFHVHDEAVMEVPIGQGSVEEACRIMAIPPDWRRICRCGRMARRWSFTGNNALAVSNCLLDLSA